MKRELEDCKINIRIKLALLWTTIMFCYIYGDYFDLYVPGKVNGLIVGKNNLNSPYKLFTATIILTIPALMIFLSVVLKPMIAKWLNVGVGIFFTVFTLLVGMSSISEWTIFYVFLSFLESTLTTIVVIMALKWKRSSIN